jgi:hypothetical protein
MHADTDLTELIVARVLERLQAPGERPAQPVVEAAAPAAEVALAEPVITAGLLRERLGNGRRVRLAPGAILTPAARDFIRARQLEVVRQPLAAPKGAQRRWQLIATHGANRLPDIERILERSGGACERRLLASAEEAASQATSAICRGEADRVVVLTAEPERVACLANRQERLRAVVLHDAASLARWSRNWDPNVFAWAPEQGSFQAIQGLIRALAGLACA